MFLINLKNVLPNLTKTERAIAFYITNNYKEMSEMTSYEFANIMKVGQSTIVRFSQKLGYKSFNDMCDDISKIKEEKIDSTVVDPKEDTYETNNKIYINHNESIKEILNFNDVSTYDDAANKIVNANKVFCIGAQSTGCIAKILSNRLAEYGIDTFFSEDAYESYMYINKMSKNDIAIVISSSGESKKIIDIANLLKKKKINIISITGIQENTIKNISDICFLCPESLIYTNQRALVNNCSQLFIVDCICMNVWKKNSKEYSKNLTDFDSFIIPIFGGNGKQF